MIISTIMTINDSNGTDILTTIPIIIAVWVIVIIVIVIITNNHKHENNDKDDQHDNDENADYNGHDDDVSLIDDHDSIDRTDLKNIKDSNG